MFLVGLNQSVFNAFLQNSLPIKHQFLSLFSIFILHINVSLSAALSRSHPEPLQLYFNHPMSIFQAGILVEIGGCEAAWEYPGGIRHVLIYLRAKECFQGFQLGCGHDNVHNDTIKREEYVVRNTIVDSRL